MPLAFQVGSSVPVESRAAITPSPLSITVPSPSWAIWLKPLVGNDVKVTVAIPPTPYVASSRPSGVSRATAAEVLPGAPACRR